VAVFAPGTEPRRRSRHRTATFPGRGSGRPGCVRRRHAKSDWDFATDADLDSERAILDVIAAARPQDARAGEETGDTDGAGSRRWLVDPLCGTLNFAAQTLLVAVNVALVDGSTSLAGVSADPIADELFWTYAGGQSSATKGCDSLFVTLA